MNDKEGRAKKLDKSRTLWTGKPEEFGLPGMMELAHNLVIVNSKY